MKNYCKLRIHSSFFRRLYHCLTHFDRHWCNSDCCIHFEIWFKLPFPFFFLKTPSFNWTFAIKLFKGSIEKAETKIGAHQQTHDKVTWQTCLVTLFDCFVAEKCKSFAFINYLCNLWNIVLWPVWCTSLITRSSLSEMPQSQSLVCI